MEPADPPANRTTNGDAPHRDPQWTSGICLYCDDRSGPPVVDKQTGACRNCFPRQLQLQGGQQTT